MTSPVRVAVPVALMVFTMIILYGALEMSDSGKSAIDTLWDMMYGKKEKEKPQDMEISCTGSDQNGFYQMDEDRNCTLKGCYLGYLPQNNACLKLAPFTGNEAVNCEISGYTYGACTPKPNRKCGEGAGTREKYPVIEEFASGGGTCEYSIIEDCDIECPTTCGLKPEDYSAVDNALCIGVKSGDDGDDEYITLGIDDGYCGQGTEQLQLIPENIESSVFKEFGFDTVEEYLEYANPGGVCRETEPIGCNVSCDQTDSDGNPLEDIGCNDMSSKYAYVSDPEGAVCFNSQSVNEYLNPTPGATLNQPVPLETITAEEVRNEDLTYDMSKIDDDKKTGLYLLYRSNTDMSYDNLVKNKCHLYKTEPCDAPKESVDCLLGNSVPDTCEIFNGCGQSYSKTITRVLKRQAFGDGRTCIQKYGPDDSHGTTYSSTDNCLNADPCCVDSDYKPVEGTCTGEGIQTYRLDDADCEKINLLDDEYYESPEEVTKPCDVNAVCGWEDIGTCSSEGNQEQTRTTITSAINDGNPCDIVRQFVNCDVDCVGGWSGTWSGCSEDCGPGSQTMDWVVSTDEINSGTCANRGTTKSQDCKIKECPVNCVGDWSNPWSGCSEDCGPGTQTKTWKVTTAAQHGGTCANEGTTKRQDCKIKECPVNCVQSAWTNSGTCNSSTGKQSQTRTTTTAAQNSGTACGSETQDIDCDVDCVQGAWTNSGVCNSSTGKQSQTRTTTTAAKHGGTTCGSETRDIFCAVDCVQSAWTNDGVCSEPCGAGKQSQTRTTTFAALNGGTACEGETQEIDCKIKECPVPAVCGWTTNSVCSVSPWGKQTRTRTTTTAALHGGAACGSETKEIDCTPTAFDNEKFYIKDMWGEYLGLSGRLLYVRPRTPDAVWTPTGDWFTVTKEYFILDGSFDGVSVTHGGETLKHNRGFAGNNQENWKFERQSDGGFKILVNGGTTKKVYMKGRKLTSSGDALSVQPNNGWYNQYDKFYLEAAT